MFTDSSRFAAGDLVVVRNPEEILATLDAQGRHEGVPFMPEMLAFCGHTFRVAKRAHKTCDFVNKTGVRALPRAVHLANLRCNGSAHGGCQARCLLFWKDAWLRHPGETATDRATPRAAQPCTFAQLERATFAAGSGPNDADPAYACQATLLPDFTQPLSPWNARQYIEDYRSGNVRSWSRLLQGATYRAYDNLVNLGIGLGRPLRALYNFGQRLRGSRRLYPATPGKIPPGKRTPAERLDLQPGELVRVKDHAAILATIDEHGRNHGLSFSAEMAPFCGQTFRVLGRVDRILDEKTGRMLHMKHPCIILDGVTCGARYNKHMIFCPRATYAYWREIWLERTGPPARTHHAPRSALLEPHYATEDSPH